MLTAEGCRNRQQRLLQELEESRCDLFLTGDYRTVYYFTGVLGPADAPAAFVLWQDGASALITSAAQESGCAGEVVKLETYSPRRPITQPVHDAAGLLRPLLGRKPASRAAVERAGTPGLFEEAARAHGAELVDATAGILRLRRRKEADELEEIRGSLRCCAAAYRAARETIAPGLTEIDVYNRMYAAVASEAGTAIPFPGDFACGERGIDGGGPPTTRLIQPGDLYILDIFPAPALYAGDTCRTFAVGPPTDLQQRAWELVREAVRLGEGRVRPGVAARDVYQEIKDFLDSHEITGKSFWHHAGHGIGHRGHEAPRMIPGSADVFEEGDVITLEPGVYSKALQGGIRLEDNYVVRRGGLENLFDFPMELSLTR